MKVKLFELNNQGKKNVAIGFEPDGAPENTIINATRVAEVPNVKPEEIGAIKNNPHKFMKKMKDNTVSDTMREEEPVNLAKRFSDGLGIPKDKQKNTHSVRLIKNGKRLD